MTETATESMFAWCAGLRFAANRELSEEDRADFLAFARRSGRKGWKLLAGIPIGFAAIAALGFAIQRLPSAPVLLAALGMLHLLLGTSVLISLARDAFRDRRAFQDAAKAGYVCRFEGTLEQADVSDPAIRYLFRQGFLNADLSRPQTLEVLPDSGLVWRVNELRPSRWVRAATVQVADPPESAARAAQWVRPLVTESGTPLYGKDRPMSSSEREEVRRYSRRALWGQLPWALFGNAILLHAIASLSSRKSWIALLPALLALYANYSFVKSFRTGLRLSRDWRAGWILIVRESLPGQSDADPAPDLAPPREVLPISGFLWNDAGLPAPWRRGT